MCVQETPDEKLKPFFLGTEVFRVAPSEEAGGKNTYVCNPDHVRAIRCHACRPRRRARWLSRRVMARRSGSNG